MAISQTIELMDNFGERIVFADAYIRVDGVDADKTRAVMRVSVRSGQSGRSLESRTYSFVPDMNGPNFIRQAYLHLKTLPEFAGATDC